MLGKIWKGKIWVNAGWGDKSSHYICGVIQCIGTLIYISRSEFTRLDIWGMNGSFKVIQMAQDINYKPFVSVLFNQLLLSCNYYMTFWIWIKCTSCLKQNWKIQYNDRMRRYINLQNQKYAQNQIFELSLWKAAITH